MYCGLVAFLYSSKWSEALNGLNSDYNQWHRTTALLHSNDYLLLQGQQPVADAVLLLPPYYFSKVPDAGIENFITAALQSTKLPAYLYNYSVHTGNVISVESYEKLTQQLPHLRGIKCTVTAMSDATPYKEALPHLQVSRNPSLS